jgi:hypothetical protein
MDDAKFWYFEEAKNTANALIVARMPQLSQAKIQYLCTEKCSKKGGKLVLGKTKKASPRESFFLEGCHYIVEIGNDGWITLNPHQREALIYHLLSFCFVDVDDDTNEYTYGIQQPDINEFADVISRYGWWHPDLEKFGALVKSIDFSDQVKPEPKDARN